MNFDSIASGAAANSAVVGQGLGFDLAAYLPELDEFGDPIPGSEAYRIDPDAVDVVRASNPNSRLYGNAPSPLNALDAIDQGVLITFDTPLDLSYFAVTLDLSSFGFPGSFDIVFQDQTGAALATVPTFQSIPGSIATLVSPLSGVASIYLPSGAYYDDLTIVPEPGSIALLGFGLAGLAAARRGARRREVR